MSHVEVIVGESYVMVQLLYTIILKTIFRKLDNGDKLNSS